MTRTTSLLFLIGLVIAASLALYRTSNQVQELDHQLHSLNAAIEGERQNMHVLKAEWVFLANPTRVEAAAKKHLDALRPTAPKQIASLGDIGALLPARGEAPAPAAATVSAKPLASLRSTLKTTIAALPALPGKTAAAAAAVVALVRHKPAVPAAAVTTLAAADTGSLIDHAAVQRTASAQPNDFNALLDRLNTGTR